MAGISGGIGFDEEGRPVADLQDRLGHGTAVAAAIREKAPSVDLLAVKVFDRRLVTTGVALVAGIRWAIAQDVHLISLSLGTRLTMMGECSCARPGTLDRFQECRWISTSAV